MSTLTAIESEFTPTEEAKTHDAWFRAKVQEALEPVHKLQREAVSWGRTARRKRNIDTICEHSEQGSMRAEQVPFRSNGCDPESRPRSQFVDRFLESEQPYRSHDEAMAHVAAQLDALRKARAAGSMDS
jgi:hypothetical protein